MCIIHTTDVLLQKKSEIQLHAVAPDYYLPTDANELRAVYIWQMAQAGVKFVLLKIYRVFVRIITFDLYSVRSTFNKIFGTVEKKHCEKRDCTNDNEKLSTFETVKKRSCSNLFTLKRKYSNLTVVI